jgi:hypothetical protein
MVRRLTESKGAISPLPSDLPPTIEEPLGQLELENLGNWNAFLQDWENLKKECGPPGTEKRLLSETKFISQIENDPALKCKMSLPNNQLYQNFQRSLDDDDDDDHVISRGLNPQGMMPRSLLRPCS